MEEAKERAMFEAWYSDQGKWPQAVQRSGEAGQGGYRLAQTQSAWVVWLARAAVEGGK